MSDALEASASSIRPATLDDLENVAEIEARVHAAPWGQGAFAAELAKPYAFFLLVTDDDTDSQVMAYLVYWVMDKECQVLNVAVDLPYRGRGLAKALLRKAFDLALRAGAAKAVLDVRKSNQGAVQLYQALGFAITNVRKGFYSNGEDAYHMSLSLEEDGLRF